MFHSTGVVPRGYQRATRSIMEVYPVMNMCTKFQVPNAKCRIRPKLAAYSLHYSVLCHQMHNLGILCSKPTLLIQELIIMLYRRKHSLRLFVSMIPCCLSRLVFPSLIQCCCLRLLCLLSTLICNNAKRSRSINSTLRSPF